jgi:hypothetical protein
MNLFKISFTAFVFIFSNFLVAKNLKGTDFELEKINEEKKMFLNTISSREDACLLKFFSGDCLERLDVDYQEGMRRFNMRRQEVFKAKRREKVKVRREKRGKNLNY